MRCPRVHCYTICRHTERLRIGLTNGRPIVETRLSRHCLHKICIPYPVNVMQRAVIDRCTPKRSHYCPSGSPNPGRPVCLFARTMSTRATLHTHIRWCTQARPRGPLSELRIYFKMVTSLAFSSPPSRIQPAPSLPHNMATRSVYCQFTFRSEPASHTPQRTALA